jgi:integrase
VLYIPFSEATPKHVVRRGKTPVLTEDQARRLLASIKVVRKVALGDGAEAEEPWLVGLRDRALMAVMTYTFARVGAVVAMRVEDYYPGGKRWWVRLHEKGGKRHEMPAHHKLEQFLDEYLAAAGIRENGKTPLFRSALGETGAKPMNRVDAYGAPAHGRRRLQGQARLPRVLRDRHHRLSRGRWNARIRPVLGAFCCSMDDLNPSRSRAHTGGRGNE